MELVKKTCFKCKQALSRSEFYAHRMMADGLLGKCKACAKADVKAHRQSHLEQAREAANRRYREDPVYREKVKRRSRLFGENSPVARAAQTAVNNAIRDRKLFRGPCEQCGALKVSGHHDDYLKPLSVRWLCQQCHLRWHNAHGPGKNRDSLPEKKSA